MSREWKPGDVALVEAGCWANRKVGLRLAEGWAHVNGTNADDDGVVSPVRPLVVIDPEDREQVERLADAFKREGLCAKSGLCVCGDRECVTGRLTAALCSFIAPPKPERPTGWGAVVEDNTGAYWTQYAPEADVWINYAEGKRQYADITAVRVLSEGVTA